MIVNCCSRVIYGRDAEIRTHPKKGWGRRCAGGVCEGKERYPVEKLTPAANPPAYAVCFPETTETDVTAVNRGKGLCLLSSGEVLRIVTWFDMDGDEVAGAANAVSATAGPDPRGKWWAVDLTKFETDSKIN